MRIKDIFISLIVYFLLIGASNAQQLIGFRKEKDLNNTVQRIPLYKLPQKVVLGFENGSERQAELLQVKGDSLLVQVKGVRQVFLKQDVYFIRLIKAETVSKAIVASEIAFFVGLGVPASILYGFTGQGFFYMGTVGLLSIISARSSELTYYLNTRILLVYE